MSDPDDMTVELDMQPVIEGSAEHPEGLNLAKVADVEPDLPIPGGAIVSAPKTADRLSDHDHPAAFKAGGIVRMKGMKIKAGIVTQAFSSAAFLENPLAGLVDAGRVLVTSIIDVRFDIDASVQDTVAVFPVTPGITSLFRRLG